MKIEMPTAATDVVHTDDFVFQREPRSNRWTCYRVSDGFEVGSDASLEDCTYRAEVFQAVYTGESL